MLSRNLNICGGYDSFFAHHLILGHHWPKGPNENFCPGARNFSRRPWLHQEKQKFQVFYLSFFSNQPTQWRFDCVLGRTNSIQSLFCKIYFCVTRHTIKQSFVHYVYLTGIVTSFFCATANNYRHCRSISKCVTVLNQSKQSVTFLRDTL